MISLTGIILRFLVLLTLCHGPGVFAQTAVLKVDDDVLDGLQAEEKRAATNVMKRVEGIRSQFSGENRTKFGKMRELFAKAEPLSTEDLKGEAAFAGQCVTKAAEEVFYPGLANLYLERDPLLGKQIYLVPTVSEGRVNDPDYIKLDLPAMRGLHETRRNEKSNFTALQFGLGKEVPLSDIIPASQKKSVFFTYRLTERNIASGRPTQGTDGGHMVLFSARTDRAANGQPYVIVQRLCPYSPGCKLQGNSMVDYLNYVDAFGYCYYTRMHYLVRGR